MWLRGAVLAVLSLALLIAPGAHAADSSNRGLSISPVRLDMKIDAGQEKSNVFTIANITDKSMTVVMSIKKFDVQPLTYDYLFSPPDNDWIKFDDQQVMLKPGESKRIIFTVTIPKNTIPGGYYYTLTASSQMASGAISATVQATSLLYLTINGNLIRTSQMRNSSIPWFVMGDFIPYKFEVEDTGNVHFSAHFFGQIESIFGALPEKGTDHFLMPHAARVITDTIPSPTAPGIYRVVYGYKPDYADIVYDQSAYILFLPPWSIVAVILILLVIVYGLQQQIARRKTNKED